MIYTVILSKKYSTFLTVLIKNYVSLLSYYSVDYVILCFYKDIKNKPICITSEELPFQLLRYEILTEDREEIQALP